MEYQGFRIIGIEKDMIEKDSSFETAYKYPYILSARPDDMWVKFFHTTYRLHSFEKKRQYTIMDKHLIAILSGEDSRQQQLDFFKEIVEIANQKYREVLILKEDEKRKEEARKKKERERIQEMREETERLNFS